MAVTLGRSVAPLLATPNHPVPPLLTSPYLPSPPPYLSLRSVAPLLARLSSARAVRQQELEAKAILRVWRGTTSETNQAQGRRANPNPYPNPNPNPNPNTNQAQADDGRERVCVRHSM